MMAGGMLRLLVIYGPPCAKNPAAVICGAAADG